MPRLTAAILILISISAFAQEELTPTGIEGLEKKSWVILDSSFTVRGERTISLSNEQLGGRDYNYVAFYVKEKLVAVDEIPPFQLQHDFGNFTQKVRVIAVGVQYRLDEKAMRAADTAVEVDAVPAASNDLNEHQFKLDDKQASAASEEELAAFSPDEDTVTIISPTRDIYAYGVITLKAEVEAPAGAVVRVDFTVDGELAGSADMEPYEIDFDFGRGFNARQVTATAVFSNGTTAEDRITTVPLEQSDFFVRSQLVTVEATVVDWRDRIITDLEKDDFKIWEDGEEQDITHFAVEQRPLRVAILLDASGSMAERDKMSRAVQSAQQFLNFLDPEKDKVALIAFTDVPNLISGFTSDFAAIKSVLNKIEPAGGTAISDTLGAAAGLLEEEIGRKAIVLVTDGIDQHSTLGVNDAVEMVRGTGAKIYSIGIYLDDYYQQQQQRQMNQPKTHRGKLPDLDPTDARKRDQTFKRGLDTREVLFEGLADATGGAAFFPETLRELPMMFERIANELRNSYAIGYVPTRQERNGEWRAIDLEVKRSGLTVKAKDGYYAKKQAQPSR